MTFFPSEYSFTMKSGGKHCGESSAPRSSTRSRLASFLRSVFRPTTLKAFGQHTQKLNTRTPSPTHYFKPVRSTSQYEYLSEVLRPVPCIHLSPQQTRSRAPFTVSPYPYPLPSPAPLPLPPQPPPTPLQKHDNSSRAYVDQTLNPAMILFDVRVVSLDIKPIRSQEVQSPHSGESSIDNRAVFTEYSRPYEQVCTETVEIAPRTESKPRKLEKRVISVANISVGEREMPAAAVPLEVAPDPRKLEHTREKPDHLHQRRPIFKDRILADWERNCTNGASGTESSFSSLSTTYEPMLVDDGLKEIPSPNLRTCLSPSENTMDHVVDAKDLKETGTAEISNVFESGPLELGVEHKEGEEEVGNGRLSSMIIPRRRIFSSRTMSRGLDVCLEGSPMVEHLRHSSKAQSYGSLLKDTCKCGISDMNGFELSQPRWFKGETSYSSKKVRPEDINSPDYEVAPETHLALDTPHTTPLYYRRHISKPGVKQTFFNPEIVDRETSSFSIDDLIKDSFSKSSNYPLDQNRALLRKPVESTVFIQRSISGPAANIPTDHNTTMEAPPTRLEGDRQINSTSPSTESLVPHSRNYLRPRGGNINLGDIFINDSIDLGEAGRINYRTGSFLSRFTERNQETKNIAQPKSIADESLSKRGVGKTLSDYMLCSDDLNPDFANQHCRPYNGGTSSIVVHRTPLIPPVPKVSIELSKMAELDPVLALLKSDVTQLDEFRNSFREKGVGNKKSLSISPSTAPQRPPSIYQSNFDRNSSIVDNHRSSHESASSASAVKHEEVDDAQQDLHSQLHELIELEFSSIAKKATLTRKNVFPKIPDSKPLPENEHRKQEKKSSLRGRQDPFQWSQRQKHSSPYTKTGSAGIEHSPPNPADVSGHVSKSSAMQPTVTPEAVQRTQIREPDTVREAATLVVNESRIVPTTREALLAPRQLAAPVHTSLTTSRLHSKPSIGVINMFIPRTQDSIPLWVFCASQINVLRRMAQTQITLTQEAICPSNRLIRWRIGRSKGIFLSNATSSEDNQNVEPCRESPVNLIEAKSPSSNPYVVSPVNQTPEFSSDGSVFWPEQAESAAENVDAVTVNAYGASRRFTGPLFGRSLSFWQNRVGHPFPPCISNILAHLQEIGHSAHGIFRRAGGKRRIQALRECLEKDLYWDSFEEWQPYDLADLLKQFFRELPECLLTNKLGTTLINIFHHTRESVSTEVLRMAMMCLADENRIALQSLLYFLNALASRSAVNQMNAQNLSICLAPSIFRFASLSPNSGSNPPLLVNFSPRRRRNADKLGGLEPKDMADQIAAQKCLCVLINEAPNLFVVTEGLVIKTRLESERLETPRLSSVITPHGDVNSWLHNQIKTLLQDCSSSVGGSTTAGANMQPWRSLSKEVLRTYFTDSGANESLDGFEIAVRKPFKSASRQMTPCQLLRTWRCSLFIPVANPREIADKFWNDRASWDENVLRSEVMDDLDNGIQVQRVLFNALPPQPARECRLLRGIRVFTNTSTEPSTIISLAQDLDVTTATIVSTSVDHGIVVPEAPRELLPLAHFFREHLLIERVGEGCITTPNSVHSGSSSSNVSGCRVTLISEADIKGYSQEWYTHHWGHLLLRRLLALRHSFGDHQAASTLHPK